MSGNHNSKITRHENIYGERSSNVLPLHLKQIFTEGVGDGIKSWIPSKIFSTLKNIILAGKKCFVIPGNRVGLNTKWFFLSKTTTKNVMSRLI